LVGCDCSFSVFFYRELGTGNRRVATGNRQLKSVSPLQISSGGGPQYGMMRAKDEGKMKVRFFKPFDEISGRDEMDLDLKGPVQVKEVLGAIEKKVPTFQRYLRKEKDEVLNFFVVLVRGDEILKLNDWVQDQDTVKILPPISGG
jgi:molybdopterin converting factor small subunit